ncbi:MAG: hypothetical protein K2X11_17210 [Acetobacteraceae bacterium]|nr:hypothetical protein [Acetobacteraceae bacterium]
MTLVVLLVQRAGGGGRAVAPTGAVSLDLPEGTRILGVAGAGDRFAVHVEGPGGGRVLLLDARGRLVGEIWPQRAPQPPR